jgi:glycine/D-amino acid oxidase-like deaminating enzyme
MARDTGALIADELAGHGHDVVVLDQRDPGWGSTSASTALLESGFIESQKNAD